MSSADCHSATTPKETGYEVAFSESLRRALEAVRKARSKEGGMAAESSPASDVQAPSAFRLASRDSGPAGVEGESKSPVLSRSSSSSQSTADSAAASEEARAEETPEVTLHCSWCIWARFQGLTMKCGEFSSVEECRTFFNAKRSPLALLPELLLSEPEVDDVVELFVFREDAMPNEASCSDGGQWIAGTGQLAAEIFNELWLNLVMATILAVHMGGQRILGTSVVCHPCQTESKMTLWMCGSQAEQIQLVGEAFRKLLQGFGYDGKVSFEHFSDHVAEAGVATEPMSSSGVLTTRSGPACDGVSILDTGQRKSDTSFLLRVDLQHHGPCRSYRVEVKNTFIDDIMLLEDSADAGVQPCDLQRWRTV